MRRIALIVLPLVAGFVYAPVLLASASAAAPNYRTQTPAESVLGSMDRAADPCNDFYRYACGGWLDATPLPADQPRWSRSFSTIAEHNREMIRTLLEDAAANPGAVGSENQKIGNYYGTCMDEAAVERGGLAPLGPWLGEIAAIDSTTALFATVGRLQRAGVNALFSVGVLPDFKTPTLNISYFFQGGLGLPDRDYYLSDDAKKQELLAQYRTHVARVLALAGASEAAARADADAIVGFETELAKASRTRVEMRQIEKLYNRLDRAGLDALTPTLPWSTFFTATGHPEAQAISVATPEFFEALTRLAAATPMATLRAYLRWNVLNTFAAQLPKALVDADFEFYGRLLSGQAEIQPRWKRCVAATGGALGEAIGKLYVEREFAGDSKAVALEMVHGIESAFESNLPSLAWMDDATRDRAREKARKVANKIGYPDTWRDYSQLPIAASGYLANTATANAFEHDRQWRKVGQPVDKSEWAITPQTVNAYYNPTQNDINFPAGILQPPFFRHDYPAAMSFGGIGAVVGHELTHGFDDQGRKFDGDGVLREWWEPAVADTFTTAAACVDASYSAFEVEPGAAVNGQLTLGENIADLGGLKQALVAFKARQAKLAAGEPAVPGLSDEQLLFVSWAQVWCTVASPEYLRQQVTTDPHSPAKFRAIVPPMHTPGFREAFGCKPGDAMVPATPCTVW